ncbi:MAG: hypothetical protein D6702_11755 [Planctomycetota bacterium]|nr:MAG: hypothetical protein D6702_11755 [Planctomycetota bacterium]
MPRPAAVCSSRCRRSGRRTSDPGSVTIRRRSWSARSPRVRRPSGSSERAAGRRRYPGGGRERFGAGASRGLQSRWGSSRDGPGGFDSHALPPAMLHLLLTHLSLAVLAAAQAPAAGPPPVVLVRLDGPLDEAWASMLRRAGERAAALDAEALVLELDTPGGEVELMKRLGDRLDAIGRERRTIAFVDSRALSAGSYLAMACQEIWLAPAATIGAATPIALGPGGVPLPLEEDVAEKNLSAFRAVFRGWAEQHGRDPAIAEAFVDNRIELQRVSVRGEIRIVNREEYEELLQRGESPSFLDLISPAGKLLTLTTREALDYGFADGVAAGREELLAALGWTERPLVVIEANWSERLVRFLGGWSWLLMLAAAFFLVVSFQMPGLGAPEAAAVLCIALFLFHGWLVGLAEWTEVLLVAGGLALLAVEVFLVPGTLAAGLAGGLLLFGGLLLAMQDFVLPRGPIESGVLVENLIRILLLLLLVPFAGIFLVRRLARSRAGSFLATAPSSDFAGPITAASGESALPGAGARGRALTPLRPAGRVEIDGEPYDALCAGEYLPAGAAVTVTGRRGASLLVAPAPETLP